MSAGPLGTVAGGADLLRDVREQLRDSQEAQRRAAETQAAILNALPAHVALIDAAGVILAVNDAWRCAATANALQGPDCGVGQNYIELCERARGDCAVEAAAVAAGVRRLLQGESTSFAIEYPCH